MLDSPFKLSQNKNRGLESHSYPHSVLDLINLTDEYESGMSGTSGKSQFVVYLLSKLMGCRAVGLSGAEGVADLSSDTEP